MSANPGEGKRFRPGLPVIMGLAMITVGLCVSPPGYWIATLGNLAIVSGFMRAVAWGLSACLLVFGGLLVALRPRFRTANVALTAVSCIFSLVVAEGGLAALGFNSPYHLVFRVPKLVPWITTDPERGTRIVPGKYFRREWPVNHDGFGDMEEFVALPTAHSAPRILFLGDSFTFGINASVYEKAFVSIIKKRLKEEAGVTTWNTAMPGTGQPQELDSLRRYFPLLEPDVVVLGFCMNDFNDDRYPVDALTVFSPSTWVFRYELDASGKAHQLSLEQAYRRAMMAPTRPLEYIATSRVGYLVLTALTRMRDACTKTAAASGAAHETASDAPASREPVPGYIQAREYLRQIREYVTSDGARFVILAVPFENDLATPGAEYRALISLCGELGIECVDVRSRMTNSDYIPSPDLHWNDDGHRKIAEALLPRLRALLHLPARD